MKIGILSFQNTNNYGAFLQAFSLCSIIRSLGYEVELINYKNPSVTDGEVPRLPSFYECFENPLRAGFRAVTFRNFSKRYASFKEFVSSNALLGNPVETQKEIESLYDVVIVGSDQVWNPTITGNDLTYFLDDIDSSKVYKIAYAASFGMENVPQELKTKCGKALADFNALGIREKSGKVLVKDISGCESTVVLDPTLLYRKEDWEQLIETGNVNPIVRKKVSTNENYVFVYLATDRKTTVKAAKNLARKFKASVLICEGYCGFPLLFAGENVSFASPIDFLYLIQHAAVVVTSSFHGFALSLALNKQVLFSLAEGPNNKNSRLITLAQITGTEQCNIKNESLFKENSPFDFLDYRFVNQKLEHERKNSLSFLQGALDSAAKNCDNRKTLRQKKVPRV